MDAKTPVVIDEPRVKQVSGRVLYCLAAAVALLALSFVVVVAVSAWFVHAETSCDEKSTSMTAPKETESFDRDLNDNGTTRNERIVVDRENMKEYVVSRESDTGFITSMTTVDYRNNQTTVYSAKGDMCFIAKGVIGQFEDTVLGLRSKAADDDGSSVDLMYEVSGMIEESDDIPVEMTPYCSRSNTYLISKKDEGNARNKRATVTCPRQTSSCPWLCWVYTGPVGVQNGQYVYVFVCWLSQTNRCSLCPYYLYYFENRVLG